MADSDNNEGTDRSEERPTGPGPISRRALLKGTVTVMPAVLTLQSGAALARSSNLISAAYRPSTDRRGRTLCLDVNSVYPAGGGGRVYDLGDPARAKVFAINERDYKILPRVNAPGVSEARACLEDQTVYYLDRQDSWTAEWETHGDDNDDLNFVFHRNWKRARIPRGVFVSATALSSFAGNIVVREI